MKKMIALLVCAALAMVAVFALAEAENPFDEGPDSNIMELAPRADDVGDAFELTVDGETVTLLFDDSPEYSSVEGGSVQASYYCYADDGVTLYELYVVFPDTAQAGMVISPQYAALTGEESSVVPIVSDDAEERYYMSSLMDGTVYPETSDFAIAIDRADVSGGFYSYTGRLSATLVSLDMVTGEPIDALEIPETYFSFSLGGANVPRHDGPQSTPLPQDMRKT